MDNDIKTIQISIRGIAPLMMHNGRLANPRDTYAIAMKEISSKRKKEESDYEELSHREFLGGIYFDPEKGVFVPGDALQATLVSGAKANRLGSKFEGCVFIDKDAPLKYEGPKDPEKLWASGEFMDMRSVTVGQAKVQRTRPIFHDWGVDFEVTLVAGNGVEASHVEMAAKTAGMFKGLLEYRPKYGRFEVTKFQVL
jgi:hypothetical protein